MPQKISILILTHNRADDLLALLESLSLQENMSQVLEEILILNNASDESYDHVEAYIRAHPELRVAYTWSDQNTGVTGGRNKLMQAAKGALLLTIDDDMVFSQRDALQRIAGLFEKPLFKDANTAIITIEVIYHSTGKVQVNAFPHKKFRKFHPKKQFLTYFFAGGANVMKREAVLATHAFPEYFFYGMEEYDLSYSLLKLGYAIGYDGSVSVEHKESPYGRQAHYKKLSMQWVNKSKVAWRYLPLIYFFSTALMWSFEYLHHAPLHPLYYFKSWLSICRIPFTEKRKTIQPSTLRYLRKVEARLWY